MTYVIMVFLCVAVWIMTLDRLQAIHWKDIRKDNGIARYVWLMMVFFSITMTFLSKWFCNYFDAHTLNNLDRLISYFSILIGIFFGAAASVEPVAKLSDRNLFFGLKISLFLTIQTLVVTYSLISSIFPRF